MMNAVFIHCASTILSISDACLAQQDKAKKKKKAPTATRINNVRSNTLVKNDDDGG